MFQQTVSDQQTAVVWRCQRLFRWLRWIIHTCTMSRCLSDNNNKFAQSNLGRGPRRGTVAHIRRKVPIGYNGAPQIRPKVPLSMDWFPNLTTCLIPGPVWPMVPNRIWIRSAVLPQCTGQTDRPTRRTYVRTDRPTDRPLKSLMTIGRCAMRARATRPNNSNNNYNNNNSDDDDDDDVIICAAVGENYWSIISRQLLNGGWLSTLFCLFVCPYWKFCSHWIACWCSVVSSILSTCTHLCHLRPVRDDDFVEFLCPVTVCYVVVLYSVIPCAYLGHYVASDQCLMFIIIWLRRETESVCMWLLKNVRFHAIGYVLYLLACWNNAGVQ